MQETFIRFATYLIAPAPQAGVLHTTRVTLHQLITKTAQQFTNCLQVLSILRTESEVIKPAMPDDYQKIIADDPT